MKEQGFKEQPQPTNSSERLKEKKQQTINTQPIPLFVHFNSIQISPSRNIYGTTEVNEAGGAEAGTA
jgi:hypothetical protein